MIEVPKGAKVYIMVDSPEQSVPNLLLISMFKKGISLR